MSQNEQLIHNATMEIFKTTGVRYASSEKALKLLKANGVKLEGDVAYFTEEQVKHWVGKAPAEIHLYARNPEYDAILGGSRSYYGPGYGAPFVADEKGVQRPGAILDYVNLAKLYQMNPDFHICGGLMVQPGDVPVDSAAAAMFYATLTHSDKVLFISTGQKEIFEAILEAGCAIFGGREGMLAQPRMIALVNVNSPLLYDATMLNCIMLCAEYGQAVTVASGAIIGVTSPITIAGSIASINAEVLAGIIIAQMVRPGTPVVYGVQATTADMRTMRYAAAAPEGAIIQAFGAKMAKFYALPSRGGSCYSDAPCVNAQMGYEAMLNFFSSTLHQINFVTHCGAILASGNAVSFDKIIVDFEIIRQVRRYFEGFEINDETLLLDDIKKVGQSGAFLTMPSTLKKFSKLILAPMIGSRGATKNMDTYLTTEIKNEYQRLMDAYEKQKEALTIAEPELEKVRNILFEKTGLTKEFLKHIDAL